MSNRTAEIAAARAADERIAAAWDLFWTAMAPIERLKSRRSSAEARVARYSRPNNLNSGEVIHAMAEAETLEAEIQSRYAEANVLRDAAIALDKELYTGWSRFFLVKHIHNTTHCSSFRPTTRVGWLPNVSGLTEAEAVKEHGATLCTICFPSAPTELTTAAVDPDVCTGSGQPFDAEKRTGRERMAFSPQGVCATCGQTVGLTARGSLKVRKHKVA
jgi:hypothetical protein